MVSFFLLVLQLLSFLRLAVGLNIAMPNCTYRCGDVQIPYPFGIGAECYHDLSYEIICNTSFAPDKPFLHQFDLEVQMINLPSTEGADPVPQTLTVALPPLNLCGSNGVKKFPSPDLKGSPYTVSGEDNVLIMVGCEGSAVVKDRFGDIMAGCASVCGSNPTGNVSGTACFGVGCCQSSIENDHDLDFYEIAVDDFKQSMKSNSCSSSVALVGYDSRHNITGSLSNSKIFPVTLAWMMTPFVSLPFEMVNVSCYRQDTQKASCSCNIYYEGNPYLPYGCQVVKECRKCEGHCHTNFNSTSSQSYNYCKKHVLFRRPSFLGFVIGMGVVLLGLGSYWLFKYVKRRKEIKRKSEHFKRNGGLLLQQQMSSDEGVVERTKIFSVVELEKATDNFNENRILGQGGQGTVYKGMLMDGKIVAIKKAKKVDESQIEQFVNEVVILSQINHRNVVKLLGCCLETEVPILVYEFILNGTLSEHIHGQSAEFHVNWKMRLQIAAESAGAIAYLHSSSSAPIYHRDIKSTNILLDEKYRAKVSDFGTSKAITIDQTHATTVVLGTYGYLDPEYFQSNQYTEKSDVYSFGVVLAELLTGKKPLTPTGNGGWLSLATEFLTQMEDSHLFDMLDTRVIDEAKEDEFMALAELARKCLNMNGKQRPTMKEIAVQLDGISSSYPPALIGPRPAESNHVNAEVVDLDKSMFFSDDDPPACSIEIKPLMGQDTF